MFVDHPVNRDQVDVTGEIEIRYRRSKLSSIYASVLKVIAMKKYLPGLNLSTAIVFSG